MKILKTKLEQLFVTGQDRYINLGLDTVPIKIDVASEMPRLC